MTKLNDLPFVWITTFLLCTNPVLADYCGNIEHVSFGPFDYTDLSKHEQLKVVEIHHFGKNVENLISGQTSSIGGDLNYTLSAFPNHHRALDAMSRLAIKNKTTKPEGARFSVMCYFERAIRFKPDDAKVRLVFSGHLLRQKKLNQALEQLQYAVSLEPENPTINYNLGLLYVRKKNYDKALHHARKAYQHNFPLPGLKNQLIAAGKWK